MWRSIQLNASPPKRAAPRLLPLIQTTVLCLRAVDEIDRSFKGAANVSSGTPKILELLPVVFFRCEYCLRNTTGFSISLRLYQTKLPFMTRQEVPRGIRVVVLGKGYLELPGMINGCRVPLWSTEDAMKREIIRVEPLSTYLERWKAPTSAVTSILPRRSQAIRGPISISPARAACSNS